MLGFARIAKNKLCYLLIPPFPDKIDRPETTFHKSHSFYLFTAIAWRWSFRGIFLPPYRSLSMALPLHKEFHQLALKRAHGRDWCEIKRMVVEENLLQIDRLATREKYLRTLTKRLQPYDSGLLQTMTQLHEWSRWVNFCGLLLSQRLLREIFYELIWLSAKQGLQCLEPTQLVNYFAQKRLSDPALVKLADATWLISQGRALQWFIDIGYLKDRASAHLHQPIVPTVLLNWLRNHNYEAMAQLLALEVG